MGTNYYVKQSGCEHCGHNPEHTHIGKYSMGWKFGFNSKFSSAKEWFDFLKDKTIHDEYDGVVDLECLRDRINKAQSGIWLYDPKYPEKSTYNESDKLEFLDCDGYRFINSNERWS